MNYRQKPGNHGYDVIVGGELFTDYPITRKSLVTLNPKLNHRRRTLPASFPVGGMPTAAWPEHSLRKSQDAVALQQIKERGAYL